jgi:hypothetical protein
MMRRTGLLREKITINQYFMEEFFTRMVNDTKQSSTILFPKKKNGEKEFFYISIRDNEPENRNKDQKTYSHINKSNKLITVRLTLSDKLMLNFFNTSMSHNELLFEICPFLII